jgi:plasmid replication initiation protein
MEETPTIQSLVSQSNDFILTRQKMTLGEKRLLLYAISKISPNDKNLEERKFNINVKEYSTTFGLDPNYQYTAIRESATKLFENFYYPDPKNKKKKTRYLTTYDESEFEGLGYIKITFTPEFLPHLVKLHEYFTSFKLYNVIFLKSFKHVRMYEIFKSYEYRKRFEISVDELKQILEIQNQYPLFSTFKKWVIVPALKEINKSTDISVKFNPIRQTRRIVALEFLISRNKRHQQPLPLILQGNENQETYDKLRHEFQFSQKDIDKILKDYRDKMEVVEETIEYVLEKMKTTEIKSPKPYLLHCLREDVLKPEREKLQAEKKQKEEREELKRLTKLWKDGKGTPEIEKQIFEFYRDVGHPIPNAWKTFV